MAIPRSIMIASALAVVLATPAWAQKERLFGRPQAGRPYVVNTAAGRQVEVIRTQAAPESSVMADPEGPEEIESLDLAPMPDGEFEAEYPMDDGSCSSSCSLTGCEECGMCECCCTPYWAHRTYVYGEFLYLSPMDTDMAYAFQQNGIGGPGTVPAGRVGVVDPGFSPAFRAGFAKRLTDCASIGASYANFHSHSFDAIDAPDGLSGTVASLVLHPNSVNAGSTSQRVTADYDTDFQLIDVDYTRIIAPGERGAVNVVVGARYGKLQQDFRTLGNFAPPTGTIMNTTSIQFEGVGLRTGLDGERRIGCSRLAGYGKGFINVLFGTFNSSYTQLDTTTTIVQADSNWRDQRVVPILEYELGISWTSRRGHLRFSTGYYTAFWFNTITTPQYVRAVQNANFVDLGETLSFNGFVSRCEYRF